MNFKLQEISVMKKMKRFFKKKKTTTSLGAMYNYNYNNTFKRRLLAEKKEKPSFVYGQILYIDFKYDNY
jgi:hypothetical protein